MELIVNRGQEIRGPVVARDASAERRVPRAIDGGDPRVEADRRFSFSADCECPDDCLRDHDNE